MVKIAVNESSSDVAFILGASSSSQSIVALVLDERTLSSSCNKQVDLCAL